MSVLIYWRDGRAVRVIERLTLTPGATELREIEAATLDEMPVRVTATRRSSRPPTPLCARSCGGDCACRQPVSSSPSRWPGLEMWSSWPTSLQARLAAPLDAWEPETLPDAELAAIAREPEAQGSHTGRRR